MNSTDDRAKCWKMSCLHSAVCRRSRPSMMSSLNMLICALMLVTPINADELSVLSVPLSVKTSALTDLANNTMPTELDVGGERVQTCVEAERMCTKIPEFRGFKIYSRMECIDVTPRIDCSINQQVIRTGPLIVGGSGGTITIRQALAGSATVRGRGEIGRHIRESADGALDLTVTLTPRITSEWQVEADLTHNVVWTEKPTSMLFNVIPVTFEGESNKALNRVIEEFRANGLSEALASLNLREKVESLWTQLQTPVAFTLANDTSLSLHFNPSALALAPLTVTDDEIATRLAISGNFQLSDERNAVPDAIPLLPLSSAPPSPQISLSVPIKIELPTLSNLVESKLPARMEVETLGDGSLTIHALELREQADDRLFIAIDASLELLGSGPVTVSGTLVGTLSWNNTTETLSLNNPDLEFEGSGIVPNVLNLLSSSQTVQRRIVRLLQVPLGKKLDELGPMLFDSLDQMLIEGVDVDGALDVTVAEIGLDEGLHMTAQIDGVLALSVFELGLGSR